MDNTDVEAKGNAARITYAENVRDNPQRARVNRRDSSDSLSIHTISRNRNVDPGILLPVQYRTLYVCLGLGDLPLFIDTDNTP